MSLVAKLAEVMAEIGHVPKRGVNAFHNYKYVMEADLCDAVREKLASRKVMMIPSVVSATREKVTLTNRRGETADALLSDVMVEYTLYDGESDEKIAFRMPGCGADTGDKGVYKALTGSDKYALMKAFLIPTGDDPEGDAEVDARAEGFRQGTPAERQAIVDKKTQGSKASGFVEKHSALKAGSQVSAANPEINPFSGEKYDERPISVPQGKRLYAIAKSHGWSDADIKQTLMEGWKIEHTKDIKGKKMYEQICAFFEGGKPITNSEKEAPPVEQAPLTDEDVPW